MYQRTVTLFNRKGSKWIPTVLHNVDLNTDRSAIISRYGENSSDRAILHVRYRLNGDSITIEGKSWIPPIAYKKQNAECTLTFTGGGEEFDFFCVGEWGNGSVINDADYGTDGFYDYMNRNLDGVYAISSVSSPYSLIQHFEITGR